MLNLTVNSGRYIKHDDGITLLIDKNENTFEFTNVKTNPIPSLLRQFSAPIKLHYNYTDTQHLLLIASDNDEFNQWEHLQQILIKQKISAENLLDELLNNLFLLYKKKIYYDGYNRNSNIISK